MKDDRQHSYFIFTQRLGFLLVNSFDVSSLCFIICFHHANGDSSKMTKSLFFTQVCMPVTQEELKIP